MHTNARRLCFLSVVIYVVVNLACVLGGNASKYMLINVQIAIDFEQFV